MNDTKEYGYWLIESLSYTITRDSLIRGVLKPADIVEAVNRGIERATKDQRELEDQINAGH